MVHDLKPLVSGISNSQTLYLRDNENPYGTQFRNYPNLDKDGLVMFVQTYLALIEKIDRDHGGRSPSLHASNIIFTSGAACAIEQVFKAYFEPGVDQVVITPPCFGAFSRLAAIHGVTCVEAPLGGRAYDRLDIDGICSSGAKGIVLCDPNNPVGSRLQARDVLALLERFSGLVVIDEAYVEYSQRPSNLMHLSDFPQLLILRTMSKALGMAGLRIGAVLGSDALIEPLRRVQLPFAISSVSASAAYDALRQPEAILSGISQFCLERDIVYRALADLPHVSDIFGHDSGFLSIRTQRFSDAVRALTENRIQPVFAPEGLDGWIRISIGTPCQNERLINVLAGLDSDSENVRTGASE